MQWRLQDVQWTNNTNYIVKLNLHYISFHFHRSQSFSPRHFADNSSFLYGREHSQHIFQIMNCHKLLLSGFLWIGKKKDSCLSFITNLYLQKSLTASAGLNNRVIFKIDNIPISLLCPLYISTMMQISSTLVFLLSISLSVCCCCCLF